MRNPTNLYANQPINQRRTSRVSLAKWQLPIGACADHERATTGLNLFFTDETSFGLNGALVRRSMNRFRGTGASALHRFFEMKFSYTRACSDSIVHPLIQRFAKDKRTSLSPFFFIRIGSVFLGAHDIDIVSEIRVRFIFTVERENRIGLIYVIIR